MLAEALEHNSNLYSLVLLKNNVDSKYLTKIGKTVSCCVLKLVVKTQWCL